MPPAGGAGVGGCYGVWWYSGSCCTAVSVAVDGKARLYRYGNKLPVHVPLEEDRPLIGVIVTGATGRMGRRVIDLVHADPELKLVGAVTHAAHPALGRDAGEVAGVGPLGVVLENDCTRTLPQAEVIIDFS